MTAPAPDFTVERFGTDTSGRGLYMTRYAWATWKAVLATPEIAPFAHLIVIVQGAFMTRNGGGASASAGYHDLGMCWDIRTWNLTTAQVNALIIALRKAGIAAWRRDYSYLHGGMDPHIHVTMGSDQPGSSGARSSWAGYLRGTNGLASGRADYEWRPKPLVLRPPASLFQEDYMATPAGKAQLDRIEAAQKATLERLNAVASAEFKRDQAERERQTTRYRALVGKIGGLADTLTGDARDAVLAILRDEEDVTQADNPAPKA